MELTTKFKANSEGKLSLDFSESFKPLEDYDEVVVELDHLKSGEINRYMNMNTRELDFLTLFKSKVKSVKGIDLKDEDGNRIDVTPEVVAMLGCPIFDKIVYIVCSHIIDSYTLTKEEEKNLNGDSRH